MKRGRWGTWINRALAAWIVLVGVLFFVQFLPRLDEGLDLVRRSLGLQ